MHARGLRVFIVLSVLWAGCDRSAPAPRSGSPSPTRKAAGASSLPAASQPDVILVTLDTTRADYITDETMPFFSQFARKGVAYSSAHTVASETGPAHASLLSGVRVAKHGVVSNCKMFDYPARLPVAYRRAGYETAAFVSAVPLRKEFGWTYGFDVFDGEEDDQQRQVDLHRRGCRTIDLAVNWFQRREPSRPAFMWVHLFEPHAPYDPPDLKPGEERVGRQELEELEQGVRPDDEATVNRIRDMYRRELRGMDDLIKRLHESIMATSRRGVLWAVVGDHGEELLDHDRFAQHDRSLYQGVLHVPMVIRWDGQLPAARVRTPQQTAGLAATLLKLCKMPGLPDALAALPLDSNAMPMDFVIIARRAPNYRWPGGPATAVRVGPYKAIFYYMQKQMELYDLETDPRERNNLASAAPEVLNLLREKLTAVAPTFLPTNELKLDLKTQKQLRELGYLQ